MMQRFLVMIFVFLTLSYIAVGQNKNQKVFTSDIDNFWSAYDSCRTTTDSLQQLRYIQTLYIDKGTEGLKAFMKARDYSAERWVSLIRRLPRFWNSIRPNTLAAKSKAKEIESSIQKLKKLYPELKEAKMYFTIGGLRSGGTTTDDMVLIGAEIATGDPSTDVSEFSSKWLEGVFKNQKTNNIVSLNIHEYVHTQQKGEPETLLGQSLKEGACDFITELVMGKPLQNNYIVYGREHRNELKEQFKLDMFTSASGNWLYNGSNAKVMADLGYFMGYDICKSYYTHSNDKKQAIKSIIELNYADTAAVESFLAKSKYYTEPINKQELVQRFKAKQPFVVRLEPFSNGDTLVDAKIKELKIVFSIPMSKQGYSINLSERGREYAPMAGVGGFSEDGTCFTLILDMKPDHEYEFIITDKSFKSTEGYPLRPYEVKFKTK
ncbi:hypothetical protein QNI19_19055 [Cytophagaceae bacterium DM2B3-1]|uniref:DUF2268 domain-containing protein n=1 Tax=Xanthocytophaga flava TaxID=3048013 RepID=A0ABT7CMT5_9BACT|nr:hypothetical protein [Xanthocytophaga flavus]MDJ1495046.1 hypothetical protein [Xanthocytophaga flavus]